MRYSAREVREGAGIGGGSAIVLGGLVKLKTKRISILGSHEFWCSWERHTLAQFGLIGVVRALGAGTNPPQACRIEVGLRQRLALSEAGMIAGGRRLRRGDLGLGRAEAGERAAAGKLSGAMTRASTAGTAEDGADGRGHWWSAHRVGELHGSRKMEERKYGDVAARRPRQGWLFGKAWPSGQVFEV